MTEINAYMNGYKPSVGEVKFLEASVQAHKDALKESKFETETAKEFLYQHIQTNKELEKKVERLEKFYNYFSELYGQNLQIANWHQNDELEPFDSFFDSAEEEMGEDPSETHAAANPEMYFE
jgi:hypothetical protein